MGLQKMQNGESFFGEKSLKIGHGINIFAPKIIPAYKTNPKKNEQRKFNLYLWESDGQLESLVVFQS